MQGTGTQQADVSAIPQLPYLAPWYRLAQENGRLVLSYAHSAVVLEGKAVEVLMPNLLPLLDGTRTLAEIDEHLGEAAAPAVRNALRTLTARGVLTDGPPMGADVTTSVAETTRLMVATSATGLTETSGKAALERTAVAVLGSGEQAAEIGRLLRRSGLDGLSALTWDADPTDLDPLELVVAAPEPSELPLLERWNTTAFERRLPWLQVLPFDGRIAAVGPLYLPDRTCCYECFRRRRAANLTFSERDYWSLENAPANYPSAPPLQSMAAGLAATLVLRWVGEQGSGQTASSLPGAMHAIEWDEGLTVSRHFVFRVPRCPTCFGERGVPSPWHS